MNYGAPDQYGMMRQGQPQQPATPSQQMQQQQRMQMMASAGGQMVAPMNRQGPAMYPMSGMPAQAAMQQQGYTGMTQQQMAYQQQQQQLNSFVAGLPPELQTKIRSEPDPVKKNQMAHQFYQAYLLRQRQNAIHNAAMSQRMQGGQMRPMPPSYPTGSGTPGMVVSASGMQPASVQQPGLMRVSSASAMPAMANSMSGPNAASGPSVLSTHAPSVAGPGSVRPPSVGTTARPGSVHPVPSPQVASLQAGQPGVAGTSPAAAHPGQSPAAQANPKTPAQGPQSINPPSSQGPSSQQQTMSAEEREEYNKRLREMKERYNEPLRRIAERYKLDAALPPKVFDRLVEVLEEKRTVSLPLLERLNENVQTLIERQSVTFPILEAIRMCNRRSVQEPQDSTAMGAPKLAVTGPPDGEEEDMKDCKEARTHYPDPWAAVRHLMIRVPDHIRAQYRRPESKPHKLPIGRKRKGEEKEEVVEITWNNHAGKFERPNKKTRIDCPSNEAANSHMANGMKTGAVVKQEVEEHEQKPFGHLAESTLTQEKRIEEREEVPANQRISVPCLFDNRMQWTLSGQACHELTAANVRWRIDPAHHPPGKDTPDIQICIDSDLLICCPLRVLIPLSYPSQSPQVLFEQSFPSSAPLSSSLEALFRRRLALQNDKSLTSIVHSWRAACEQQLGLGGGLSGPSPLGQLVSAPFSGPTKQLVA